MDGCLVGETRWPCLNRAMGHSSCGQMNYRRKDGGCFHFSREKNEVKGFVNSTARIKILIKDGQANL